MWNYVYIKLSQCFFFGVKITSLLLKYSVIDSIDWDVRKQVHSLFQLMLGFTNRGGAGSIITSYSYIIISKPKRKTAENRSQSSL